MTDRFVTVPDSLELPAAVKVPVARLVDPTGAAATPADLGAATAAQGAKADASDVDQITLTGDLVLTLPVGHPAGQVYRVTLTQDGTGGHTVTYNDLPVTVDTTAGAVTTVELHPAGAGYVVRYPVADLDAQVSALAEDGGSALGASLSSTYARTDDRKAGTATTDLARTACVSIIDDDGDAAVMSRLFPLLESKGVVGACAIITSKPGSGASWLTWAQIDTLAGAGWELLGHGHSYTDNLSEFSVDADLDYQIGEGCKDLLEQHAHTTGFVYPQNVSDVRIRRFTRRHYAYAFGGTGYFNPYPLDTMNVARIGLGSWTADNPTVNGNSEKSTLAYYQECVDYAKTNGLWLVLMTHVAQQDAAADTMLGQLLDYIAAESVPVVTPRDGYAMHGHRFWAGDMGEEWTAINEIGVTGKSTWSNWRRPWQGDPVDKPLSSYRRGETVMACGSAHPSLPVAQAGMLTTHRPITDTGGWAYARQEYVTGDARTFVRNATSDSVWGTWYELQRVTDSPVKLGGFNTYTAAQLITDYPTKSITVATNSSAAGTGFPGNAAGMTTTYRITGNGWDRQEFRKYNSAELWTRYVDASTGAWTSWVQIV